jgi:hypothetical protein
MMQSPDEEQAYFQFRQLLLEVAETLEAVIVALQAERGAVEPGFVIREAVRRVVQLRQHLDSIDQTHTG